jgi:hypothetical protein
MFAFDTTAKSKQKTGRTTLLPTTGEQQRLRHKEDTGSYPVRHPSFSFSQIPLDPPSAETRGSADANSGRTYLQKPAPPATSPVSPAPPAQAPAQTKDASKLSAEIALSGDDKYEDLAGSSSKTVDFNVTWKGGRKEDYVIVQLVKGHASRPDDGGLPLTVPLYGKDVRVNFPDFIIDSPGLDPVYFAKPGSRWNYRVTGENKFSASDQPIVMMTPLNVDPVGTKVHLEFKTGVYRDADIPHSATGGLSATPLDQKQWSYHQTVMADGTFDHSPGGPKSEHKQKKKPEQKKKKRDANKRDQ